jgi:DNA processing protein
LDKKIKDEKIGFVSPFIAYEIKRQDISDEEEKILSVLDEETPIHIDDIIKRTGLDPSQVLSTLISLEIKSLVVEEGMGYYKKPPSS